MKRTLRMAVASLSVILMVCVPAAMSQPVERVATGTIGASPQIQVGLVLPNLNPFWLDIRKGAQREAKRLGVKLTVDAGRGILDYPSQEAKIEDAITKGADALLIVPNQPQLYEKLVDRLLREKRKIVLLGINLPKAKVITSVITSEFKGGLRAGQYLKRRLPNGGKLGVLHCLPGNPTIDARVAGMKRGIRGTSINVVSTLDAKCDATLAATVIEDMITAQPDLDAIFSPSDTQTLGALPRLKAAKASGAVKDSLIVVSYDAQKEAVKKLMTGEMDATVAQFPDKWGEIGLREAVKAVRGGGKRPARTIDGGTLLVTRANAKAFLNRK